MAGEQFDDRSLQDRGMGTPSPSKAIPMSADAAGTSVPDEALAWLGVVILTIDPDGVCRDVRGQVATLGIDRAATMGRAISEILPEGPPPEAEVRTFTVAVQDRSLQCWKLPLDRGSEIWLRADATAPLLDYAGEVRRICHDLNNTILALRCVCDGVTMATGSSVVRADDLIDEISAAIRTLSSTSRAAFGLEHPHASPEPS